MFDRRMVLRGIGSAALLAGLPARASVGSDIVGSPLASWQRGTLDIHHLATGRGDAIVVVSPNGKLALVDAGAVVRPDPALVTKSVEAARDPGQWIAQYVRRRLAETGGGQIDGVAITHLHPDHVGAVQPGSSPEPGQTFQPTGISRVARTLKIGKLIDPCYPEYGYPSLEDRASIENYIGWVHSFAAGGGAVEHLRVGETGQILPDVAGSAPFSLRSVAGRGRVWTGHSAGSTAIFPARKALPSSDYPNENAMSAAFLLEFGRFRYFTAGDLTGWGDAGARPWMNALDPATKAVGRVNVATMPHHGMFDGSSTASVRALAARDWIISAWHAAHPSMESLERVFNARLFAGERSVYATSLHPATELAMDRLTSRFSAKHGNIICRVASDARSYRIIVTDPGDLVTSISETRYL